jgi:hypothetical protein
VTVGPPWRGDEGKRPFGEPVVLSCVLHDRDATEQESDFRPRQPMECLFESFSTTCPTSAVRRHISG